MNAKTTALCVIINATNAMSFYLSMLYGQPRYGSERKQTFRLGFHEICVFYRDYAKTLGWKQIHVYESCTCMCNIYVIVTRI